MSILEKFKKSVNNNFKGCRYVLNNLLLTDDQKEIAEVIKKIRERCQKVEIDGDIFYYSQSEEEWGNSIDLEIGGLFMNPIAINALERKSAVSLHLSYEDFRLWKGSVDGLHEYIGKFENYLAGKNVKIINILNNSIGDSVLFELLTKDFKGDHALFQNLEKIFSYGGSAGGDTIDLDKKLNQREVIKQLIYSPNIEDSMDIVKNLGITNESDDIKEELIGALFLHVYGIDFKKSDYWKIGTLKKITDRIKNLRRYGVLARTEVDKAGYSRILDKFPDLEIKNVNGSNDKVTTPKSGENKTNKQLKGGLTSSFSEVPGGGHSWLESPDKISLEIRKFLD